MSPQDWLEGFARTGEAHGKDCRATLLFARNDRGTSYTQQKTTE